MLTSFSNGVRRKVAYRGQAGATTKRVPLRTASEQGDVFEGVIRVPTKLCRAQPNTNEKHEFDRLILANLKRWADWREKKGWTMASTPKVTGPYDIPTTSSKDETNPDEKEYRVWARFKLTTPLFVSLEDVLHERDEAERFGVDLEADRLPWNDVSGSGDSGWVDPMAYAEERRQKLGIKRSDYLYSPLDKSRFGGRVRTAKRLK